MSTQDEEKALFDAIQNNNLDEVRRLISQGVNPTGYKNPMGVTAIMCVADNGNIDILKLLVESGGDINVRDNDGWTAILYAAFSGNCDIIKLLVDNGGEINVRDEYRGVTPIMCAASEGNIDILKLLVENGGDINVRDNEGISAIDFTEVGGHIDCFEYLREHLKWLSRRDFLMFLATQSYLPAAPPPLADTMPREDIIVYYQQFHNPDTRPHTAVHTVFFMEELQRYIISFLGAE